MKMNGKTKRYECLIFDADHTLLDYIADEMAAFTALYQELGMKITPPLLALSRKMSEENWTAAGLYDVHDKTVQKNYHKLYRSHVQGIFENIFSVFPCSADPFSTGKRFLELLENDGHLFEGVKETLGALSNKTGGRYEICIATNGLNSIQKGRLKALEPFASAFFVSEHVGYIKPLPQFFERILKERNRTSDECLMIGDSLSSDVAGARAVGMDSCWLNPERRENTTEHTPDYEIAALPELLNFL
ncbi:MAG: HAD family hydrolase [Clostridia bacterium]|nr:HAD family hydrolase [Clostridia bacterium]